VVVLAGPQRPAASSLGSNIHIKKSVYLLLWRGRASEEQFTGGLSKCVCVTGGKESNEVE
jgi:hypothetical protein